MTDETKKNIKDLASSALMFTVYGGALAGGFVLAETMICKISESVTNAKNKRQAKRLEKEKNKKLNDAKNKIHEGVEEVKNTAKKVVENVKEKLS